MPTQPTDSPRPLPERPDLRHLKDQAKDLLKGGGATSITDAQFRIARQYGFVSWSKLKSHVASLQEVGEQNRVPDFAMISHLKNIIVLVRDMKRVAAFYRDTLGFRTLSNPAGSSPDDWLEFDTGTCRLTLHRIEPSDGTIYPGMVRLRFFAPDVEAARRALIARGVAMREISHWGDLQRSEGKDPEGNVFGISNCKYSAR